jgi:hypothetical protein
MSGGISRYLVMVFPLQIIEDVLIHLPEEWYNYEISTVERFG